MKTLLKALALVCMAAACFAQTAVVLAPLPRLQFFDQSGRPLAFGCVFSFQSGTTTPLATYTDSTGVTLNQNPVILSAGGSANIWLIAGQSYSLKLKGSGGTQCASGSTQYTINGIGGGASTLVTVVPSSSTPTFTDISQNQLFEFTLTSNTAALPFAAVGVTPPGIVTFQLTQDSAGNHTFAWPTNVIGGANIGQSANSTLTQQFVWNGTVLNATGSGIIGPASFGNQPYLHTGTILNSGEITTDSLNVNGSGGITSTDITASGSVTAPTINATTGYQINGSYGTSGQIVTSTGSGTQFSPPIVQYSQNGTLQTGIKLVSGAAHLSGGTATAPLLGSAIFSGSFQCWGNDVDADNAVSVVATSGSLVTITGTSTDHVQFTCMGTP